MWIPEVTKDEEVWAGPETDGPEKDEGRLPSPRVGDSERLQPRNLKVNLQDMEVNFVWKRKCKRKIRVESSQKILEKTITRIANNKSKGRTWQEEKQRNYWTDSQPLQEEARGRKSPEWVPMEGKWDS